MVDFRTGTEKQNMIEDGNGNLRVRYDLTQWFASSMFTGKRIARGWVNKNPRTDEIWIYLVTYTNTTGLSYIEVYEESGTLIQQYSLGAINNPDLIWMSVVQDEIMFNGPSIGTPVYGRVGGGLSKAVQTTSINPDTTTIAIPRGLCCSWQGRNVIASGNNIFVSDPQDIRAYVGDNFVNFDSQIYSLHEIGANLFVVTGSGVFAVPGETADNQIIFGARSKVSSYQATGFYQTAVLGDSLFGIVPTGIMSILDNNVITVSSRAANRVLSIPVEFINYQQFGSLYKYETAKGSGVALSIKIGNSYQWCMVSRTGLVSWWTQQDALVGSGPSRESEQLFITSSSILKPHGNAATVLGVISGVVQKDPETSVVIRYVTMVSDNSGFNQSCAVRNSVVTVATSTRPSTVVPIVGTSTWGSVNYQDPEDITTRMEYNERTQDFAIEIAADEAGSKLGVLSIETASPRRRGGFA